MSREFPVTPTPTGLRRFSPRWVAVACLQVALLLVALSAARPAAAATTQIVVLGDSLVAGYGLAQEEAFPARLEAALKELGHDVAVANAGVSGDTSAAGLARLDWSVPDGTDIVIVELGANDALRGLPPEQTEANIDKIVGGLKERGIAVMVAGMLAPPNMGADYEARFNPVFARVAERHGAALYPFFLEGVAAVPELNQADAMHPNAAGVDKIVENFLPAMEVFLREKAAAAPQ